MTRPPWPPLFEKELDNLRNNRFRVDSLRMSLRRQAIFVADTPTYTGPGFVEQSPDGALQLTLYDETTPFDDRPFVSPPTPGVLIERSQMFELAFRDLSGLEWHSSHILVDLTQRVAHPGAILHASLQQLECRDANLKDARLLWLHFPEPQDLPVNELTHETLREPQGRSDRASLDTWHVSDAMGEFYFKRGEASVEVSFTPSGGAVPNGLDSRIEETLWFVLARRLRWKLLCQMDADGARFVVLPQVTSGSTPRVHPPLVRLVQDSGAVSDLFRRYLNHVCQFAKEEWHPLSVDIDRVLRGSQSFLEDEALALSLVVETILRRDFPEVMAADKADVEALEPLNAFIRQWEAADALKQRVTGMLSHAGERSMAAALRALGSDGLLTESHIAAWGRLRHASAHGRLVVESHQALINDCALVHQLVLFLVFRLIGYSGPFTDYAATGWPTHEFPVPRDGGS